MILNRLKRKLRLVVISAALLSPSSVFALSFEPNEGEWLTWGEMCQARYVVSGAGQNTEFRTRVSSSTVNLWKQKLGNEAWYGLHHYCAGLIMERRGDVKEAVKEYIFTINRMPSEHYLYIELAARLANAYYSQGKKQDAYKYAVLAVKVGPKSAKGYMIKGLLERKEGNIDQAIDTLENGFKNTSGTSAELNYHLGLAYYAKGKFVEAKKYAEFAYNLGYPLPWLKDQLVNNGYWQ